MKQICNYTTVLPSRCQCENESVFPMNAARWQHSQCQYWLGRQESSALQLGVGSRWSKSQIHADGGFSCREQLFKRCVKSVLKNFYISPVSHFFSVENPLFSMFVHIFPILGSIINQNIYIYIFSSFFSFQNWLKLKDSLKTHLVQDIFLLPFSHFFTILLGFEAFNSV